MDFIKLLKEEKLTLIVSLPENNLELAKAALEAGADVIKVHINVEHRASKTHFKSLKEELPVLKEMVTLCKLYKKSIGIVAGGHEKIPMEEIEGIIKTGFQFVSIYDKHMNPEVLSKDLYKMVAIDNEYNLDYVNAINSLPIDVLECSIMASETYGQPLTVREIIQYKAIRNTTDKPMVIPSQRAITPEQCIILQQIGVNAVMIGAVVTGKSSSSIYKATSDFRKVIDTFNNKEKDKCIH